MKRLAFMAALLALGCAGSGTSDVIPRLPESGTKNLPEPTASADEGEGDDPWAGRTDLIQQPQPQPPAPLEFPEVGRFELRNGLEVLVVEDPSVPTVGIQLAVRAGRQDVPLDKIGLDSFTAALLTLGTRRRSGDEIAQAVQQAGAQLAASAGYEATLVSCAVASRRVGSCLSLLSDLVARPSFPDEEVEKVRERLATQVAERRKDAAKLATAHLENLLFGDDHPRGRPMSGATVEAVSREDLKRWHRTYFRPNNAVLAVVGDVRAASLRRDLERAFSSWRRRRVPARPSPEAPEVSGIEVRLVDAPGAAQAQVRIGRPGVSARDERYHAALVAAAALGDEGQLLPQAARARFGESAIASASLDRGFAHRGALMGAARVRSGSAVEAARMLMTEVGKLAEPGPAAPEVAKVAARLAGSYPRRLQSSLELAGALLAAEIHGFGDGFVRRFAHELGSVTREQVKQAAADRFSTEDLVVVLLGPAAELEPQLAKAGWVYEKVAHTAPVSGKEREELAEVRTAPVDPKQEKRARDILDKALEAKGGRKRLAAVKTLQWSGDAKVNLPGGEIRAEIQKRYVAPDKLRLDMHLIDVKVKVTTVVNGVKAWAREETPKGTRVVDLPATEVRAARAQLWRDQDFVLLRHLDDGADVRPLPDEAIGGEPHHAIQLTSPGGKHSVTLLIDKKSFLLMGMKYIDQGMKAEERLTGYRRVKGLQIAHQRRTKSPQMQLEAELSKVLIDAKVDPALFSKPE